MADIENLNEMNENFDTIKTLLNSIRAQGILNTSDVDKLLSGINTKLEKINTEEDIDLIKAFLTELKQNLDERHSVLISKFGAIESLFSSLLKNSNEQPKSAEIKELFDIVATNLSVFSREVVAQKESLTEISLRLDAIRSDDSQKKDIIKNITLLRPDLERLNNGFDTIVLSLNDNFKTLAKTISAMDKTEHLDKFADSLNGIEMSSNALLSAIQLLDKKAESVDETIKDLATKSDIERTGKNIDELKLLNRNLNDTVSEINNHYGKIDVLADKIDASVNIIAGLKVGLEDLQEQNSKNIIENLDKLEAKLQEIKNNDEFEEFKASLYSVLKDIAENTTVLNKNIETAFGDINSIIESIKTLDIKADFENVASLLGDKEASLKNHIEANIDRFSALSEANLNQIINNISLNADSLSTRINQTQAEISSMCEGSFGTVFENIAELKKLIAQIDENEVLANNAMFSNISDRLNLFEMSLKESLEVQENITAEASAKLCEQVENIKNLSNVLDYKMDSSVVEISNMTRMFDTLKASVDDIIALNFVETVKDLRTDIYASKQEINTALENTSSDLSENLSKDLYSKYELLISKLDSIDDDFKKTQSLFLISIKEIMEKISASIVDVLSYVSEAKDFPTEELDKKLTNIADTLKETNLNYVESVRDVVDVIRIQVENNLNELGVTSAGYWNKVKGSIEANTEYLKNDIKNSYEKLLEIKQNYEDLRSSVDLNTINNSDKFEKLFAKANSLNSDFDLKLASLKNTLLDKITDFKKEFTCESADKINEIRFNIENLNSKNSQEISDTLDQFKTEIEKVFLENSISRESNFKFLLDKFEEIKTFIQSISSQSSLSESNNCNNITENLAVIQNLIKTVNSENTNVRKEALDEIWHNFDSIKKSLDDMSFDLSEGRKSGLGSILENIGNLKEQMTAYASETAESSNITISKLTESYEDLKTRIDKFADDTKYTRTNVLAQILDNFVGIKDYAKTLNEQTSDNFIQKTDNIVENIESVKSLLNNIDKEIDEDLTRQLSIIESNFESLISQISILNDKTERTLADKINIEYQNISEQLENNLNSKLEEYKSKIETTFDTLSQKVQSQSDYFQARVSDMNTAVKTVWAEQSESNIKQIDEISDKLKNILEENIKLNEVDYIALKTRLDDFTKELESNNEILTQNLKAQLDDMTKYVDSVLDIQVQETGVKVEELEKTISSSSERVMLKLEESKALSSEQLDIATRAKADIVSMSQLVGDTLDKVSDISLKFDDKTERLINLTAESSANELKSMTELSSNILEQIEIARQSVDVIKDFVSDVMQKKLNNLNENIEKETDTVVSELIEQFDLMKKYQQDSIVQITSNIEAIIADKVYNNIEDLKSYLDVKTDSSMMSEKLDNLKIDIITTMDNVVSDMNKMLRADLFTTALTDYRVANEILVNSATDRINEKIATFIGEASANIMELQENGSINIENKLALFDKKFVETVVDKFEEIKLISNKYNTTFDEIKDSIGAIISEFQGVKNEFEVQINRLIDTVQKASSETDNELRQLNDCFENLRSQISNKSFDEAFQASINKQIVSLENLIKEQFTYIEDINDLCSSNLPDVAELNTLVKEIVIDKLDNLYDKIKDTDATEDVNKGFENVNNLLVSTAKNISEQLEERGDTVENLIQDSLKETKSEIITQFLNIFNQISFVTEQEEILDFIQEKHDYLIKVLSHIVTNSGDIAEVKESVNSVKDEISVINQKISNIISSDGNVDYIYSLQDLESDIAHLRIVLKEMKDNTDNYGDDFSKLMESTDGVYKLVESIKEELPDKKSFEDLTEDIVSISTRTNKLILASDESYKTLTDNLHEFKLVINDLDERTRNFAQESGMDRIDSKLNALNSMVQNGAKTNQVFNEVFEYLAEWVDNAGNQINAISNKVDSLDDIGQIKVMLQDLKAEAEDNSENVELVEALSTVFDKQAKRISTLESKLDKMIVETTINNKNNKIDMRPMEDTLNKFLAAIGEKISSQQEKIDSLESQMKEMVNMLDEKATAQLTKKVGGMDRQIAKLNKSIEKIASHVVEK